MSGKVHFLTDADLPKAKELGITAEDFLGHGAIYTIKGWAKDTEPAGLKQRECTDFMNPDNFPKQIVKAIKNGQITYGEPIKRLLTPEALAEYKRIEQPAFWSLFAKPENRIPAWR